MSDKSKKIKKIVKKKLFLLENEITDGKNRKVPAIFRQKWSNLNGEKYLPTLSLNNYEFL